MSDRTRLGLPGGKKSLSQIQEQLKRYTVTGSKLPLAESVEETKPPKLRPSPYDPGAKPLVEDVVGAILYGGVEPDSVLAKIRGTDGHISFVGAKTAAPPLDYLRFRSPKPISNEQFMAGQQYLSDHESLSVGVGSNTAAVIAHLENSVPWTRRDFDVKDAGDMMPYGTVTKAPKDVSNAMLQAAFRQRRSQQRINNLDRALLFDFIIREYSLGIMAQRWGKDTNSIGELVRAALWNLAKVYEETNAEFRSWLVLERSMDETS